jgi:transposase
MDVNSLTKISLVWELHCEGIPKLHIANKLDIGRATVYRWLDGIEEYGGLNLFLDAYQAAKKGERAKRKINPLVKLWVWELREKHNGCCGQKIQYHLKKEKGIYLGTKTIYKILSIKYKLRSKWKKNQKRGSVPKANAPREVVQMDTIDFGELFAFTAVDIFSKEADVLIRPSLEAQDGQAFLHTSMQRRFNGFSDLIQTDGGPEFKREFKKDTHLFCNRHRYSRPYKKNEQSFIESFNRSLRKECLGWTKYKQKDTFKLTDQIENYLVYYHEVRPHISLNMQTPLEFKQLSHF